MNSDEQNSNTIAIVVVRSSARKYCIGPAIATSIAAACALVLVLDAAAAIVIVCFFLMSY